MDDWYSCVTQAKTVANILQEGGMAPPALLLGAPLYDSTFWFIKVY